MHINTLKYGTVKVTEEFYYNDRQALDTVEMDNEEFYQIYEYSNTFYAYKLPV
jgi:hypothetical protein